MSMSMHFEYKHIVRAAVDSFEGLKHDSRSNPPPATHVRAAVDSFEGLKQTSPGHDDVYGFVRAAVDSFEGLKLTGGFETE